VKPGHDWRAQGDGFRTDSIECPGCFDELVIVNPYIHVEQMNESAWFVALGGYRFWVQATKGKTIVSPYSDNPDYAEAAL